MILKKIKSFFIKERIKKISRNKSISEQDALYVSRQTKFKDTQEFKLILRRLISDKNENLLSIFFRNGLSPSIKIDGDSILNPIIDKDLNLVIDVIIDKNRNFMKEVLIHSYQLQKINVLMHLVQKSEINEITPLIENILSLNDENTYSKLIQLIVSDDDKSKVFCHSIITCGQNNNNRMIDYLFKSYFSNKHVLDDICLKNLVFFLNKDDLYDLIRETNDAKSLSSILFYLIYHNVKSSSDIFNEFKDKFCNEDIMKNSLLRIDSTVCNKNKSIHTNEMIALYSENNMSKSLVKIIDSSHSNYSKESILLINNHLKNI